MARVLFTGWLYAALFRMTSLERKLLGQKGTSS
jgi:hypothetical protein